MNIQLIEGAFSYEDTITLLSEMVKTKIKFHENKILQNSNEEDIKYRESKIINLQNQLTELKSKLNLESNSFSIKATIQLKT